MEKLIDCMYEIIECYLGVCDKEKMTHDENGYPVLGIKIKYFEDKESYAPANQFYAMKEVFLQAAASKSKQLLESEKKLLQNSNIDEIKRIDKNTILQYIKDHNKKSKHSLELIASLIYDRIMHVDDRIKSYSNIFMVESESAEELDDVEIKEITGEKKGPCIITNHLRITEDDEVICNETIICYGSADEIIDIAFKRKMIKQFINFVIASASETSLVSYTSLIDELYYLIITFFNENASFEILSVFDEFNFRYMLPIDIEELRANEVISDSDLNSIYGKACDRINEQLLYLKSIEFLNISDTSDRLKCLLKSLSIIYSSLDFLPAEILRKMLVAIPLVYSDKEISGYINDMINSLIRKKSFYE